MFRTVRSTRHRLALSLLVACTLAAAPARAEDQDRVAELERKVDVLVQEIETLRLGPAADTAAFVSRFGLGPGASRVYARDGVSIGGYGEMLYENFDRDREDGTRSGSSDRIDFLRQVLYVGYTFNDQVHFNSEIELEHAGVSDEAGVEVDPSSGEGEAELSGEVVLEFAYVDWMPRPGIGVRAGLLLVPVGLVNEMHEPPSFIGARRPEVERSVIPATWSANGAGVFGTLPGAVSYRAYVMEGLDASGFSATGGIRGGRQSGSQSLAGKPAFVLRADWEGVPGLTAGASVYTGDAWQGPQPAMKIAPRVTIVEGHARCEWRGLDVRGLYASGTLDDAGALSDALGLVGMARLGERFSGGYVAAGYDVLQAAMPGSRYRVSPYARFERFDTQDDVPGGSEDPAAARRVLVLGAALQPHPNVVLKLDRQVNRTDADTGTDQWNVALGYVF